MLNSVKTTDNIFLRNTLRVCELNTFCEWTIYKFYDPCLHPAIVWTLIYD